MAFLQAIRGRCVAGEGCPLSTGGRPSFSIAVVIGVAEPARGCGSKHDGSRDATAIGSDKIFLILPGNWLGNRINAIGSSPLALFDASLNMSIGQDEPYTI